MRSQPLLPQLTQVPLANTMPHEARGFVRMANHVVKLMRAHAFLTSAHRVGRQKPFRHRDMRTVANRTNRSSEFLPESLQ